MLSIAIIVPALNEEAQIAATLGALQPLRRQACQVIVVDGGSGDQTMALAEARADQVLLSAKGRAVQMNAGAAVARTDILWFLHADTIPPSDAATAIRAAMTDPKRAWGRFNVRLSGHHPLLRIVETLMNLRSCGSGIATGDQGIFVRRELYERIGGFPAIPLMEDIAICRLLKRHGRPACLRERVQTSSRRWERDGILRTILLMWWLRLRYFFGSDPERLARIYYRR